MKLSKYTDSNMKYFKAIQNVKRSLERLEKYVDLDVYQQGSSFIIRPFCFDCWFILTVGIDSCLLYTYNRFGLVDTYEYNFHGYQLIKTILTEMNNEIIRNYF